MIVSNVHRRAVDDVERVADMLNRLASERDQLWPNDHWPPMTLDRPLQLGARGGHGPIRYQVEEYEPGQRVRFRFERPRGLEGHHEFHLLVDDEQPELVHVLEARLTGTARLYWPLILRPMHDDLIEDALANASHQAGPRQWSPATRVLRVLATRARRARRRFPFRGDRLEQPRHS